MLIGKQLPTFRALHALLQVLLAQLLLACGLRLRTCARLSFLRVHAQGHMQRGSEPRNPTTPPRGSHPGHPTQGSVWRHAPKLSAQPCTWSQAMGE